MYQFGKKSLKNLERIHPNLVKVLTKSIEISPHDFSIVEGVRTAERQQALYSKGRKNQRQ